MTTYKSSLEYLNRNMVRSTMVSGTPSTVSNIVTETGFTVTSTLAPRLNDSYLFRTTFDVVADGTDQAVLNFKIGPTADLVADGAIVESFLLQSTGAITVEASLSLEELGATGKINWKVLFIPDAAYGSGPGFPAELSFAHDYTAGNPVVGFTLTNNGTWGPASSVVMGPLYRTYSPA